MPSQSIHYDNVDYLEFAAIRSASDNPGVSPIHCHPNYEMYVCCMPHMQFLINGTVYEIRRNDLILFNSFDIHQPLGIEKCHYERMLVHFAPEYVHRYSPEGVDLLECFRHGYNEGAILHLDDQQADTYAAAFEELVFLSAHGKNVYGDAVRRMLCLIGMLLKINEWALCAQAQQPARFDSTVEQVTRHISAHLTENLSLDELSARFFINKNLLIQQFKTATGVTPHRYILLCRVAHARVMLSSGSSVTDAAFESGFGNLSHFIRMFKQITGCTPHNFKADMRRA